MQVESASSESSAVNSPLSQQRGSHPVATHSGSAPLLVLPPCGLSAVSLWLEYPSVLPQAVSGSQCTLVNLKTHATLSLVRSNFSVEVTIRHCPSFFCSFISCFAVMSEDAKTAASRARRILYVANPGSDSEGSEEDNRQYTVYPNAQAQSYNNLPPPLPSPPTHSPHSAKAFAPQYVPTPLTTNLPPDHGHHYQSSRSNPTLSSPSSTSSPAVESTPPPSTPGLSAPPVDLSGEGPASHEQPAPLHTNDRPEGVSTSRAGKILQTLKSPFHHRSSHQSRPSATSIPPRPATVRHPVCYAMFPTSLLSQSPTVSTDSYSSPTNQSSGSAIADKVLIVVTSDSERYLTVDISRAKDSAVIRERIFTKVCSESSLKFIYLTSYL